MQMNCILIQFFVKKFFTFVIYQSCVIITISVLPPGRSLVPALCPLPFPHHLLLSECCKGSRRDTHGVYRPWHSAQILPIEAAHETEGRFLAFEPYFIGDSFFLRWVPHPSSVAYYDRLLLSR